MSEIRRVVARPVVREAVLFDGSLQNKQFLEAWGVDPVSGSRVTFGLDRMYVPTPDGTVIGALGAWVLKNENGVLSVVHAADFDALFEFELEPQTLDLSAVTLDGV